jgi:hypothetical protein
VTVGNIALRDAVVRTVPDFGVRLAPVPLISATGQTATGQFAPLPTLRLGGMAVHQVMGIFAQLHIFDLWKLNDRPAILIGIDVLRHFHDVTLDFGRKRWSSPALGHGTGEGRQPASVCRSTSDYSQSQAAGVGDDPDQHEPRPDFSQRHRTNIIRIQPKGRCTPRHS